MKPVFEDIIFISMKFSFDTHCKICTEELDTKPNILGDQCGKWIRRDCTDVTLQEFEMLDGSGENIQFFCDECSSSRGELKGLEKRRGAVDPNNRPAGQAREGRGGTAQLFMLK